MFVVTVDEKNRSLFEHMVAEEFLIPWIKRDIMCWAL